MKRSALTPSLYAPDVAAAVAFYTERLGFDHTGRYEDDGALIWAEVALGEVRIWFFSQAFDKFPRPAFSGLLYIFVDDVDASAAAVTGKGVKLLWGPEDMDYGLREAGFEDLNGYLLAFAKDV